MQTATRPLRRMQRRAKLLRARTCGPACDRDGRCSWRSPSVRCPCLRSARCGRLAEAEGLARVELAVSSAREGIRQSTEDLLTAARILGERPALQRLLRGPCAEIQPVLARYCESVALDGCVLVRDGELISDHERSSGVGPRARRGRGAGRALPRDGCRAGRRVVGRAGRRHGASRHHGHRPAQARRAACRAAHGAHGGRDRDRRLRVVRARRGAARDLEHRCVVARRRRRGLRGCAGRVRRELAGRVG